VRCPAGLLVDGRSLVLVIGIEKSEIVVAVADMSCVSLEEDGPPVLGRAAGRCSPGYIVKGWTMSR